MSRSTIAFGYCQQYHFHNRFKRIKVFRCFLFHKMNPSVVYINEADVLKILTWPLVNEATEQALKSIVHSTKTDNEIPFSNQPARNVTIIEDKGILFSMPGYAANYKLNKKHFSTLACKLVTCFKNNENREEPIPNILANILLFDNETGRIKCIIEATQITGWRTASASIVATKYLYLKRHKAALDKPIVCSIIGCGVQGRIHALGFLSTFNVGELRLWNRNIEKAEKLLKELEVSKEQFVNTNVILVICNDISDCCNNSDIIITATFSSEPLLHFEMLKRGVHICAVGAGPGNHHSEISEEVYRKSQIFVDSKTGAKSELGTLKAEIKGEIGELILNQKIIPDQNTTTIFQSMGMAIEDATVAQAVYEKFVN